MRGRKKKKWTFSFISFGESYALSAFPDTALDSFSEGKRYISSRKIKTNHPRSQAKNEEQKSWDVTRRKASKTGNWLGQTCGKSRQPTRPLMEVPIRQPLPLHPALSSALSSGEDLFQRSGASVYRGKHSRITFYQARLHRRRRWHAGSMFLRKERGRQPQPVPLILI